MHPARLPRELGTRFFVTEARALGVTRSRLRNADLDRPFHGVRATAAAVADDTCDRTGALRGEREQAHIERARRYVPRMAAHEFFSHITAAVIWGVPLPGSLLHDLHVHVAVPAPQRARRAKGMRGHQVVAAATRVVIEPWTGLPVTDPATTWATLGAVLRDPYDLIAAGDAIVRTWRVGEPLASIDELAAAVGRGRRVGVGALREALPHLRARAASRPESHARLHLVDGGLPEPELNFEVWADGEYLGAVDLAYPGPKVAIEYEGEHHLRDPRQWAYDIERYERLRAAGWIVVSITKAEVFDRPDRLIARVRAALASRD